MIVLLVLCVPVLLFSLDYFSKSGHGIKAKPTPKISGSAISLQELQELRTLNVTSKATSFPNWHSGADSKRFTDEAISYLTRIVTAQNLVTKADTFSIYYGKPRVAISCGNDQPTTVGGNGSAIVYCSALRRFVIAPSSFRRQKQLIVDFVNAVATSTNSHTPACVAGVIARKFHDQGKVIAAEAIADAHLRQRMNVGNYAFGYANPSNCSRN